MPQETSTTLAIWHGLLLGYAFSSFPLIKDAVSSECPWDVAEHSRSHCGPHPNHKAEINCIFLLVLLSPECAVSIYSLEEIIKLKVTVRHPGEASADLGHKEGLCLGSVLSGFVAVPS